MSFKRISYAVGVSALDKINERFVWEEGVTTRRAKVGTKFDIKTTSLPMRKGQLTD